LEGPPGSRPPKPLKSAPDAREGAVGWVKMLDVQLNGIVPGRFRHVIKRYLKRIGLRNAVVEHEPDANPLMLRLVAVARAERPITREQVRKIQHLRAAITREQVRKIQHLRAAVEDILRDAYLKAGHSSRADPEALRLRLAEAEPSLRKVYYAIR